MDVAARVLGRRAPCIHSLRPTCRRRFQFDAKRDSIGQESAAMGASSIEWTNVTWNPIAGCTVVSAGCTNCYAMRMAARLEAMGNDKYHGLTRRSGNRFVWTGKVRLEEKALDIPFTWSKPRLVFVNSMSDLFHEEVPPAFIARVWKVMQST